MRPGSDLRLRRTRRRRSVVRRNRRLWGSGSVVRERFVGREISRRRELNGLPEEVEGSQLYRAVVQHATSREDQPRQRLRTGEPRGRQAEY